MIQKNHIHMITAHKCNVLSKLTAWFKTTNTACCYYWNVPSTGNKQISGCKILQMKVMIFTSFENTNNHNSHKPKNGPFPCNLEPIIIVVVVVVVPLPLSTYWKLL